MRVSMNPAQSPIFVVGNCRSGTTLLRVMLSAHPRIYITHEATFYSWASIYPKGAPRREFLEYYFQTPEFRWLRVDPDRVLAGLPDPLPPEQLKDALVGILREAAARYGRVRFGDKTPLYTRHLGRIFLDFPDARVIHIVRDPRTRTGSLVRMPWACPNLFANAYTTELDLKPCWRLKDKLLQIRMEDLLSQPRETMAQVLEHVGEPWDDAVLDHVHRHPDKDDMPPLPWLESSKGERKGPPDPTKGLTPVQVRMIERVCEKSMKQGPYEPAKLEREPSALAVLWECLRYVPSLFTFAAAYWRLSRVVKDPRNFDGPAFRDAFRKINPPSWAHYPGFEVPLPPALRRGESAKVDAA
jgi:hypothetical protein